MRAWLKERLREEGLWGKARVVTASCLDICPAEGVTISMQGKFGNGSVRVMDSVADREALLAEIREIVGASK